MPYLSSLVEKEIFQQLTYSQRLHANTSLKGNVDFQEYQSMLLPIILCKESPTICIARARPERPMERAKP